MGEVKWWQSGVFKIMSSKCHKWPQNRAFKGFRLMSILFLILTQVGYSGGYSETLTVNENG